MTKVKKLYINRTLKKMGLGKEQTPKEIGDEEPTWIVYLKPKWYPQVYDKTQEKAGQVLQSFILIKKDEFEVYYLSKHSRKTKLR